MDQSPPPKADVTLERLRSFVRVAERGNLTAVARELGLGQSSVTRHLRELETAVGAALLSRTTRRVALTAEGARYYAAALQILRLVDEAGAEARGARDAPAGLVRISCTAAFGVLQVAPAIYDFQDRYPDVQIDLSLSDAMVDMVRDGVDVAVRLGPLQDSGMKLRAVGRSRRILVAAPSYLAARGRPQTPADLIGHEGVRMINVGGSDRLALYGPDGVRHDVPFDGRLRVDHGLAARDAYRAGRGLGAAHLWLVEDLLATGALEPVLPGFTLSTVPLNLLIAPERAGVARVRLLVDDLIEQLRRAPGIDPPR